MEKEKLGPNDTLNTIRKQLRLPNNIFFCQKKVRKLTLKKKKRFF